MKRRNALVCLILTLALVLGLCPLTGASADTLTAVVDNTSSYKPTQIVNGDFSSQPFMGFVYNGTSYTTLSAAKGLGGYVYISSAITNGVNGGWNTTETQTLPYMGLFEYNYNSGDNVYGDGGFVEMNACNSAMLYQDLTTYGGDIIRWTLQHHSRPDYGGSPQIMYVDVGAPEYSNGKIVAASGVNSSINPHIQSSTLAQYKYNGITAGSGTVAFINSSSDLTYLSVAQTSYESQYTASNWHTASGVYAVPDGQSVTRFGFIAATAGSQIGGGNMLDNITFSTLIGNLSVAYSGGNVIVKGYWGDTDTSKKLVVKIDGTENKVDMSSVRGKNFMITIPAASLSSGTVEVYHEDYESAKRTVEVVSAIYVSATGNDITGNGTVANPYASLSRAYQDVKNSSLNNQNIALLSDITMTNDTRLIVDSNKSFTITSAKQDGGLVVNTAGNYDNVYTVHRGDTTYSMIYQTYGNVTVKQVKFDGGSKSFVYSKDNTFGGGYILFMSGNTSSASSFTMGTNSAFQNNWNIGDTNARAGALEIGIDSATTKADPQFIMESNAVISGNKAPRHGGAITIYSGDIYMKDDAKICKNGIDYTSSGYFGGGAILVYRIGQLHMSGNSKITDNYVDMHDKSNVSSTDTANAIRISVSGKVYVSENAQIFNNTVKNCENAFGLEDNEEANLYDGTESGGAIIVDGAMGSNAKIGVRSANNVVANSGSSYTVTDSDAEAFFDDTGVKTVKKSGTQLVFDGTVQNVKLTLTGDTANKVFTAAEDTVISGLKAGDITVFVDDAKVTDGYTISIDETSKKFTVTFDKALTGSTMGVSVSKNGYKVTDTAGTSTVVTYKLPAVAKIVETGKEYAAVQGAVNAAASGQTVQLLKDVAESVTIAADDKLTLDLNGKTLSAKNAVVIDILAGADFTLDDSQGGTGVVTTNGTSAGTDVGGIYNKGTFTLKNGNITNIVGANNSGGVRNTGTMYMRGGKISNCKATGYYDRGGGICNMGGGKLYIYDGEICNNTGDNSWGSGIMSWGGTVYMYGGSIHDNTYSGIYCGTMYLLGGTITGNGTGVTVRNVHGWSASVTVGGEMNITGNKGSNLYLWGATAAVSTDTPLTGDACVGVTRDAVPTSGNPVAVTNANSADYSSYFTSDNTAYTVINEGTGSNQVVKLAVYQAKVVDKDGKETLYAKLTDAAANAPEGSTINVLQDVSGLGNKELKVMNSCTVDLQGHTISGFDTFNAANGATVYVKNGTINSVSGSSCVGVVGTGTMYVEDVTMTGYNIFYTASSANHVYLGEGVTTSADSIMNSIYSSNGSGVLHITDGVYTVTKLDDVARATRTSSLFITGGCFKYDGVASTLQNYVPSGYVVKACTDTSHGHAATGYYTVELDESKVVVELKHTDESGKEIVTKFASVQDAINAAAEGDVIQLTKDLTENLTVPAGKNVVIDLNGKTVTAADSTKPVINNKGTLILTDSVGGGDLTGGKSGVEQNGTLSVGGKLDLTGDGNTNGNIYLPTGKTVDPATVPYAPNGMKIGVTTEEQPEGYNPVKITSESAADTSSYFSSDEDYAIEDLVVGDKHYTVIYGIRKIVLTSSSASKTYDGLPLTKAEVRVTEGNFLSGDSFTYVCTGSMTNVGCASNEFTYTLNVKSKLKYEVTCEFGTLTVEPVPGKNLQPDTDDLRAETEKLIEENPGSTVSVWMEINRDVPNKDKLTLQYKTSGKQSIFYQANIYAKIDGETTDIGDTNETVIGVTSKFYFAGRKDIHVYRLHNGTDVDELTETPNANGEYVIFDTANDQIIVKAMKYSTFCFVWKGEPPRTGDNTNLWLYVGMAAVSVLGVATIVVSKKKRKG